MNNQLSVKNKSELLKRLIRVGDIIYFQGPLLTLFQESSTDNFYIFDWVDRDENNNRWLVYKVLSEGIMEFVQEKISHLALFNSIPNRAVYYLDIDAANKSFFEYPLFELNELPQDYLPNPEAYFDKSDCPSLSRIENILSASLSKKEDNTSDIAHFVVSLGQTSKKRILNKINAGENGKFIYSHQSTIENISQKNVWNKYNFTEQERVSVYKNSIKKSKKYANQLS